MMIVELTGSHYEMGRQHAQKLHQYRAAISDLLEAHRKKIETYPRGAISEIMEEMRDVLSLRSSQTLDMIHGIADGFGLSRNDLLSMMIGSYYEDKLTSLEEKGCHEDGCTTWAYSGKEGRGKTFSWQKTGIISSPTEGFRSSSGVNLTREMNTFQSIVSERVTFFRAE